MVEKKAKETKPQLLGTKDVADKLKVDPKYLRQVLRSLDKYNDAGHTRYEWKPNDPFLDKLPAILTKYKEDHDRKAKAKATKKTEKKAEAPKAKLPAKKTKKASKPKAVKEPPTPADEGDGIEEVA